MTFNAFPSQQLSFRAKTKDWRKKHLEWASNKTYYNNNLVRKSILNKKINYDLINGILYLEDMMVVLNPENIKSSYIPENIQHYPIINSKLNVLIGEEIKRRFDFRVIVTNPTAISEIENNKKSELYEELKGIITNNSQSKEDFDRQLEELNNKYIYEWQDQREIRANYLINHYVKELDLLVKFNAGFTDALVCGEEIYQIDIISGEPTVERINPMNIRIFQSGFSNKIEDSDIILLEEYWNPGRIIDSYYDVLSAKDIKLLEDVPTVGTNDAMQNIDERAGFFNVADAGMDFGNAMIDTYGLFTGMNYSRNKYYDNYGNIRVLRVYWKSKRKIKKVKSYDPDTGEEVYNFYPETYVLDTNAGEEEQIFWIQEAWEGTQIGKDIYINMRPRLIQYNRLSNPSRCHFGIIGSIYNLNDRKPYSLVDMAKPYNYMYDAIHDRLNKAIAANWGRIIKLDLAQVPKGWEIDKWMHYAKTSKIAVVDSFKEGNIGAATGKLSGMMNNQSSGVIDAQAGNYIQEHIQLLEFIKQEMGEVMGISKQREGQVSNRETVGGVERATLQSSYITEWLFMRHDNTKKRVLECLLETAKIALRGRSKKFQYILSDNAIKVMDIDGDSFSENDYGLVVDNSPGTQELAGKLDMLAQAALQNQTLSFSTIMKIYNTTSMADTMRMVEKDEQNIQQSKQKEAEAQRQSQMQAVQIQAEQQEKDREQKEAANIRDNETKLLIAQLSADNMQIEESTENPELDEKIRQFDIKMQLEDKYLEFENKKHADNTRLKDKQINKQTKTTK